MCGSGDGLFLVRPIIGRSNVNYFIPYIIIQCRKKPSAGTDSRPGRTTVTFCGGQDRIKKIKEITAGWLYHNVLSRRRCRPVAGRSCMVWLYDQVDPHEQGNVFDVLCYNSILSLLL